MTSDDNKPMIEIIGSPRSENRRIRSEGYEQTLKITNSHSTINEDVHGVREPRKSFLKRVQSDWTVRLIGTVIVALILVALARFGINLKPAP